MFLERLKKPTPELRLLDQTLRRRFEINVRSLTCFVPNIKPNLRKLHISELRLEIYQSIFIFFSIVDFFIIQLYTEIIITRSRFCEKIKIIIF